MADQAARLIGVTSPLGDNVLLLRRMSGSEELGRLFRYDLELLSEKGDIVLDDVLGQVMTVRVDYGEDKQRFFSGHVAEFRQIGAHDRYYRYEAVLRPWLWFLTRTSDCRIFPDKAKAKTAPAPEIIKEVFREHGFSDFEDALQGEYKPWEHCVQYRETDFNFVSRLMEQEGIYYFFKHEDGKHTLVMCDDYNSHEAAEEYDIVPYFPPGGSDARERDHIWDWNFGRFIQPGMYAVNDFDFMRPTASLEFKSQISRDHTQADYEMYDYPGEFVEPADGEKGDKEGNDDLKSAYEKTAKTRIEELHSQFELCKGTGNARGLATGALFTLDGYMREDQDREYLIVSAAYELNGDPSGAGGSRSDEGFVCTIGAIDAKQPFRTARITPKPMIQGPQTAIVVGQSGEKVYTDQYGRVKVQFHWDRYGQKNEESSCWVRVSQNWAGARWGGMFIPHIGQEVIVEFMEGDPDRPIITGRVYNEDNMPPLPLPDDKLKSVIRDDFGNQMVFDATPGDEHILLHSPHHQSSIEIGKSIAWKCEEGLKLTTTENWLEGSLGYKAVVAVGGKLGLTVGHAADVTIGYKYSVYKGAQESYTSADAISTTKGNRVDYTEGVKVSHSKAAELKINENNFAQRSNNDITLDTLKTMCINAGDKDNAIVKMDNAAILLDFGEDGADAPDADQTLSAMNAANAIKQTVSKKAYGYATLAGTALAVDAVANLKDEDREKKLPKVWDLAAVVAGAIGATTAGIMWADQRSQAKASKKAIEKAVSDSSSIGSKNEQDKTFARVKLYNEGVKISAFESGDPNGEPDAEITVTKDGKVVINTKTHILLNSKGDNATIAIEAKSDISITAEGALNLTGDGVNIDAGGSNVDIKGAKVIANDAQMA